MKIWVDDVRPAPEGYIHFKATQTVIEYLEFYLVNKQNKLIDEFEIEVIDIDHDAGEYAWQGGDYIKILDYMEEMNINDIPIHIHSMNPVGVENMRRIIRKNNWKEIF